MVTASWSATPSASTTSPPATSAHSTLGGSAPVVDGVEDRTTVPAKRIDAAEIEDERLVAEDEPPGERTVTRSRFLASMAARDADHGGQLTAVRVDLGNRRSRRPGFRSGTWKPWDASFR